MGTLMSGAQGSTPRTAGGATDQDFGEYDDRFLSAIDELPMLTRVVLMLSSQDTLSYPEIAFRCGISADEVRIRLAEALVQVERSMRGRCSIFSRARRALMPARQAWASARAKEIDRLMAKWSSSPRVRTRGLIDYVAWARQRIR